MRKSTRIVKRLLALFLVVFMSIESFAAVVSDNDGSAFITKAEFDSLKNNFQAQIDQYNTSIDSKIDGAIAAYLAGITVAKKQTIQPVIVSTYDYLESFGFNNQLPLRHGHILGRMKCIQAYLCHNGGSDANNNFQGMIDTDYVSKTNEYYTSLISKNEGTKFYNLKIESESNIYSDLIAVGYDKSHTGNVRWENPSLNLVCGVTGYFWQGNNATHKERMENQRLYNWPHLLCTVINSDTWTRGNFAPQEFAFQWLNDDGKFKSWQTSQYSPTASGTTRYDNLTGFAYEGNPSDLIGYGWYPQFHHHTASSNWIYGVNNKTTLTTFYNVPYTYISAYWPDDLSKNYICMLLTDQQTMSNIKWNISVKRALYQQDDLNWYQPTNGRQFHVYPSLTHNNDDLVIPSVAKGINAYNNEANWQGVPYDWTYETFLFADGYDQRNLNYFNTDILKDKSNTKLNNYLRDYTTSRGFPMYVIEKEGKIEISPEFVDATKKYKIWFTKGPALTSNIETTKPTNCYDITGANADGSITVQNGSKVTFEVEKDDIVYMSWTEENKKGGGKLKYPLDAVVEST